MEKIERMRKRLHILQTKLGDMTQSELEYVLYLKSILSSHE